MKISKLVILSLSASLALAQEVGNLEEVSIVGSVEKGKEVDYLNPRNITVIDSDTIEKMGFTQLDEIIRYESGFLSQPYGSDLDTTDWLKLRGFDATLTLDGTAIYKGGYFGFSPDIYGLEKIEIIKGADSISYGSSQSGGIINLISKRPQKKSFAEVGVKVGNLKQNGIFFDINDKFLKDNTNFRLVGNYQRENGQVDKTWQEHYYIAPSLNIEINEQTFLTLLSSFQYDQGVPTTAFFPAYGTLINTPNGYIDPSTNLGSPLSDYLKRSQVSLGYEFIHYLNDDLYFSQNYKFNMENKDQFSVSFSSLEPSNSNKAKRSSVIVDGIARTHTIDNRLNYTKKIGIIENNLITGVDYQYAYVRGKYGYGMASDVDIFHPDYTPQTKSDVPTYLVKQSQLGLYLKDKVKIDNFIFNAGLRFDKAKSDSKSFGAKSDYNVNHTSLQSGIMYVFDDLGLMPFINYSQSFRPIAGNDGNGNNYKPYEGRQYETGIKYLPYFIDAEFYLTYFDLKEKNALVNAPSGSFASIQSGKQISKGVEFNSNIHFNDILNWLLAYTYYIKTNTDLNTIETIRTPQMPKNTLSSYLIYTFTLDNKSSIQTMFGVRYVGSSTDEAGNKGLKIPSYTLYDTGVVFNYKQWQTKLNIDNIFNKKYVSSCYYSCYYGEGIRASLSLSYKW